MLSRNYKNLVMKSLLNESADTDLEKEYFNLRHIIDKQLTELSGNNIYLKHIDNGVELFFPKTPTFDYRIYIPVDTSNIEEDIKKFPNTIVKKYNTSSKPYRQLRLFDSIELYIDNNYVSAVNGNTYEYLIYDSDLGIKKFYKDEFDEIIPSLNIEIYITKLFRERNQDIDFTNLGVRDKLNIMQSFDESELNANEETNDNTLFVGKKQQLRLSPQTLIKSTGFKNPEEIKRIAESNLLPLIKEKEQNNKIDIEYLSCNTLYKILDISTSGNGLKEVDIFDDNKIDLHKVVSYYKTTKTETIFDRGEIGYKILTNLTVYPPEILCPLYFTSMDSGIKWGSDGDMESKKILNTIFGDDSVFKNGKISYPNAGEQLIDSIVAINVDGKYKKIGISTKGGVNGVGVAASINSLYNMLLQNADEKRYQNSSLIQNIVIQNIDNPSSIKENILNSLKLSEYGLALFNNYPTEVIFLLTFGGCNIDNHSTIIESMIHNGSFIDLSLKNCKTVRNVVDRINSDMDLTNCIMKLLNYQKYDIAQMNIKPIINEETFKYDCSVQYPAHFDGHVDIEIAKNKKKKSYFKFHIMASKS